MLHENGTVVLFPRIELLPDVNLFSPEKCGSAAFASVCIFVLLILAGSMLQHYRPFSLRSSPKSLCSARRTIHFVCSVPHSRRYSRLCCWGLLWLYPSSPSGGPLQARPRSVMLPRDSSLVSWPSEGATSGCFIRNRDCTEAVALTVIVPITKLRQRMR